MNQSKFSTSKALLKHEQGKRITLDDLSYDLKNDDVPGHGNGWIALTLATKDQVSKLVDRGRVDEDWYPRFQDVQEEIRILAHQAAKEN